MYSLNSKLLLNIIATPSASVLKPLSQQPYPYSVLTHFWSVSPYVHFLHEIDIVFLFPQKAKHIVWFSTVCKAFAVNTTDLYPIIHWVLLL